MNQFFMKQIEPDQDSSKPMRRRFTSLVFRFLSYTFYRIHFIDGDISEIFEFPHMIFPRVKSRVAVGRA